MGTSNFYYRNASKVFAICESGEQSKLDDDGNETDFKCKIDKIKEQLEEKLKEFNFLDNEVRSQFENRNFPSTYIGTIYQTKKFGDIECEVEIICFARSGYYDGACLDWELNINLDNCNCDDTDSIFETFVYNCTSYSMNKGMLVIQGRNCDKWVNATKDKMVELIEGVFTKCSTPLNVVGRFSNGETLYEKC